MSLAGTSTGVHWVGNVLNVMGREYLDKFAGQDVEPAGTVRISERNTASHLLAVGGAVVRVTLDQLRALDAGERRPEARLSAACHAHHHDGMFHH